MARTSPSASLVAHPGLPLVGLAPQPVHPTLLLQRHPAPRMLGPALLHMGLSKHQGFVSWLNLRNKPAERPLPGSWLFTVCPHVARNPF